MRIWSAGASVIFETLQRSGANMAMGLALYRMFPEAGLPTTADKLIVTVEQRSGGIGVLDADR
jgi:hypothetical protein